MNLHNLTVCDDIRQEASGKFILVGVYSNGILIREVPGTFPLQVWFLVESEKKGDVSVEIRVRGTWQETDVMSFKADITVVNERDWTPVGFGGIIMVSDFGEMFIEGRFGEETEWRPLRKMFVDKALEQVIFS